MARRRRSGGTWFPNRGSAIGELPEENYGGLQFTITPNPTGAITTGILPVTFDSPFEGDNTSTGVDSLADIVGSEYVLKRIVGSLFISRTAGSDTDSTTASIAALVTCGFFVARANDGDVGGGADTPIGSATEAERRDNYSPIDTDTIREPWIWRRTWVLGAAGRAQRFANQAFTNAFVGNYPASTALYGDLMSGPFFDSRVKRRVAQDDRLWFVVSSANYPLGSSATGGTTSPELEGTLEYRIFGQLRKARGSSAF